MPRVTLKAVNDELSRLGYSARLARAGNYFYFQFGEAADWLDRTVTVPTVSSLTIEQWLQEFERLEKLNQRILGKSTPSKKAGPQRKSSRATEADK
ncbi:MAG: hypothetical protein U0Q18_08230 [Bryobacteraceae bacterium]